MTEQTEQVDTDSEEVEDKFIVDDEGYILLAEGGDRLTDPFTGVEIKEEDYDKFAEQSQFYGLRAASVALAVAYGDREELSRILSDEEIDLRKLAVAQGMVLHTIIVMNGADALSEITRFINVINPTAIEDIAEIMTEALGEEVSVEEVLQGYQNGDDDEVAVVPGT